MMQGILYILVQRPYDIGDKVSFSGLTDVNESTGSPGWFVEGITLFTTYVFGDENEALLHALELLTIVFCQFMSQDGSLWQY